MPQISFARRTGRLATRAGSYSRIQRRTETLHLGFVPLIDATPLLVAEALGLFTKAGLRVELESELGWGSIREKIIYGQLDAAHAPGGILLSLICGTHGLPLKVVTDLVLNLQGNAITLSRRLWQKGVRDAKGLKHMILSEFPRKPLFAVVSGFSSHHYLLRKWLRKAGIDPDHDVRILVLPPPLIAEHLEENLIDGFSSGEPWNSMAAMQGDGWIVATSATLEAQHPEKVLLTSDSLFRGNPTAYAALRAAILAACRYCDVPGNRPGIVDLLHDKKIFQVKKEVLANSLIGPFKSGREELAMPHPFISFFNHDVNRATRERAVWFLNTTMETGNLKPDAAQRRLCLEAFHDNPIENTSNKKTS